jgi:hypothetical protein
LRCLRDQLSSLPTTGTTDDTHAGGEVAVARTGYDLFWLEVTPAENQTPCVSSAAHDDAAAIGEVFNTVTTRR